MNSSPPQIGNGVRWQSLDVLRGIAVILVLFRHLHIPPAMERTHSGLYVFLKTLNRGGWVGVDLFFVLSGFLVSGILFRQYQRDGRVRPGRFLIRRAFKIYPAFWFLIAVTLTWVWTTEHTLPWKNALIELAFVQNYFSGLFPHTWSLAVEEHCYLGLCLLVSLLVAYGRGSANPFRSLPYLVVILAISVLALRVCTMPPLNPQNIVLATGPTHLRCDAFLIGSLVAYAFYFSQGRFLEFCRRFAGLWLVLGVGCLIPVFFLDILQNPVVARWLFTSNAIGGALLLMGVLGCQGRPSPLAGIVATIGEHSYSIYLWHVLVNLWLSQAVGKYKIRVDMLTWPLLAIMLSIMAGMAASYLIERPALKLRDRWFPG